MERALTSIMWSMDRLDMLGMVPRSLTKLSLTVLLLTALAGCSKPVKSVEQTIDAAAQAHQQALAEQKAMQEAENAARQQIDQIPPPAKSRYLAVHTQDNWANPFLVVGRETVHLRIILPDVNPNAYGTGTMLRPAEARKQELDVRLSDLPNALSAIPTGAWPYGRVVAVEETPVSSKADRPQIRRNVEATIQILNDLGIVVDEWTGPNGSLLR
jgi:hypothetical protein